MVKRFIFILLAISIGNLSYSQEYQPGGTPFIYRLDFKKILDKTQDRSSDFYYQKLLIRFLNNDSTLTNEEVLALMIGYTENPHYKPLENMETEEEIFEHNKVSEFKEAIVKGRTYLQLHPLSLLVLREVSFAYNRMSKVLAKKAVYDSSVLYKDSSDYFMSLNDKIMEAMIYSGKGRKIESPIFSLGLADGEHFIPNVGYQVDKKDTQWDKYGNFMEVIETTNKDAVPMKFYFIIQHAKLKIDDDKANMMAEKKDQKETKKKGKDKKSKNNVAPVPPAPPSN